jgi:ribonucleoside-triphosphate reductase
MNDLQQTVYLNSYSRWLPDQQRRETWPETVHRVIDWLTKQVWDYCNKHNVPWPAGLSMGELREAMLQQQVMPSMRVVQMAGPALDRCNVGAYNCSYLPLKDWRCFGELLYILMQGTGVGFSVEQYYIDQLPVIEPQKADQTKAFHMIADTTEGWCDALVAGLEAWSHGYDLEFDYSQIRPYGAPLATKGGQASGPEPLKNLLDYARTMMLRHQGRRLSSLNVHDLACYCGSIVQVGGVRRAAEISLSDRGDEKMKHAKMGQFWLTAPERSMANNSAVYTHKPTVLEFMADWRTLIESGTGERGIFNRENAASNPRRPSIDGEPIRWGVNPCGEIILRPFQFCNLSIAVARPGDTMGSLKYKVDLATKFGIIQSLLTRFNYIRDAWQVNCEDERLLGVDITGQMDCPLLNQLTVAQSPDDLPGEYIMRNLRELRQQVETTARDLSSKLRINYPAALTCVKPSGNSSQLLDTSSGIHPRYAPYYIRRLRLGSSSPLCTLLREQGVPHHPEVGQPPDNPSVWVFDFPVASPRGAVTRKDRSAVDQLEHWAACKLGWTEHNPSITVYVKEHEWLEVGAWVYNYWELIGGLSFLPYDGGQYVLAPYEEIDRDTYLKLMAKWPKLDFKQLSRYELTDHTTSSREYACTSGSCDL